MCVCVCVSPLSLSPLLRDLLKLNRLDRAPDTKTAQQSLR
jgi:hypothetical protein